jgi:glycosyltransferase involved in cell wall biosynthesis
MDKYLDIALQTFIPTLKAQTCKDFEFGILLKKEHIDHVRSRIGMDFTPFTGGIETFRDEVVKGKYTLQTRHDIDDWMAPTYIEEIQKVYRSNKDKYDSFVIFAQPIKVELPSGKKSEVAPYHARRISMFATLYQKNPKFPVYKGSHGALWKYADTVFELPKGLVRWVQHPYSVTNARMKQKGIQQVGNMRLYDEDHNWISERAIDPVINILTRTFKRPESFKKCRESVLSQTYNKSEGKFGDRQRLINHIVGSEVECPYCPEAIRLKKKEGKFLPWNLHLNDLGKQVKTGWVMYLDDDDMFMSPTSVQEIVDEITDEDTLLIWKVKISTWTAPNDKHFGKVIKKGQVSGIGILFHSKHLPVPWKAIPAGDFHVIEYLSKKLKVKWVNKILTGTQEGRNHHGKTPDCEIVKNNPRLKLVPVKSIKPELVKGLVTVGTPTWNNGDIFWISIESLCRQRTSFPWEYIVHECPSPNPVGEAFIMKYKDRLVHAGCVRIQYINQGKRLDLSTKWKQIADAARGEILVMHDSDDYTHPLRIERTMELIGDKPWYDTRYAWHYSIPLNKLILYDYQITKKRWKTGFNIALRTDILRHIPDPHKNAGMHRWMVDYVNDKIVDSTKYPCVATTGMNTVSLSRTRQFNHPSPPFVKTEHTIKDIGLPEDIVTALVKNKTVTALDIQRAGEKVEVIFTKDYCRLYKKGDVKRIPRQAYDILVKKHHCKLLKEDVLDPVNVEI